MGMTNIMQKQANTPLSDAQPSVLYITQGSFGIMRTVELRDDTLYYSVTCNSEPVAIDHLNPKRWQSFRQTLEFLQAEQWQPKYFNPNVLDGQQWEVKIAFADGRLIESRGSMPTRACSTPITRSMVVNRWTGAYLPVPSLG